MWLEPKCERVIGQRGARARVHISPAIFSLDPPCSKTYSSSHGSKRLACKTLFLGGGFS